MYLKIFSTILNRIKSCELPVTNCELPSNAITDLYLNCFKKIKSMFELEGNSQFVTGNPQLANQSKKYERLPKRCRSIIDSDSDSSP